MKYWTRQGTNARTGTEEASRGGRGGTLWFIAHAQILSRQHCVAFSCLIMQMESFAMQTRAKKCPFSAEMKARGAVMGWFRTLFSFDKQKYSI
jgi:hypothetical protein